MDAFTILWFLIDQHHRVRQVAIDDKHHRTEKFISGGADEQIDHFWKHAGKLPDDPAVRRFRGDGQIH